jgi:hypothetical protein
VAQRFLKLALVHKLHRRGGPLFRESTRIIGLLYGLQRFARMSNTSSGPAHLSVDVLISLFVIFPFQFQWI